MLCLPKCHFYKTTTSFNLGSQLFNVLLINFQVVNIVTSNQDCVNNIAESLVLSNLLALLHSLPSSEYVHRWAWSSEHVHRWVWSSIAQMGMVKWVCAQVGVGTTVWQLLGTAVYSWHKTSVIHVKFWNIWSSIHDTRFVFLVMFCISEWNYVVSHIKVESGELKKSETSGK